MASERVIGSLASLTGYDATLRAVSNTTKLTFTPFQPVTTALFCAHFGATNSGGYRIFASNGSDYISAMTNGSVLVRVDGVSYQTGTGYVTDDNFVTIAISVDAGVLTVSSSLGPSQQFADYGAKILGISAIGSNVFAGFYNRTEFCGCDINGEQFINAAQFGGDITSTPTGIPTTNSGMEWWRGGIDNQYATSTLARTDLVNAGGLTEDTTLIYPSNYPSGDVYLTGDPFWATVPLNGFALTVVQQSSGGGLQGITASEIRRLRRRVYD